MHDRRPLARALLIFAGGFLLLMLLWPVTQLVFLPAARGVGSVAFAALGDGATIRFQPYEGESRWFDTVMHLGADEREEPIQSTDIRLRVVLYDPLALSAAFVLALPIAWARRRRALAIALPVVFLLALLRWGILIAGQLALVRAGNRMLFHVPEGLHYPFALTQTLLHDHSVGYVVAILVTGLVALRRSDLQLLQGSPPETG